MVTLADLKGQRDEKFKVSELTPAEKLEVETIMENKRRCMEAITEADETYTELEEHMQYGTAGFRGKAFVLGKVCFRVGLIVAMRAKVLGRAGIMITGSHNMHLDNGVKIFEPDAQMFHENWEKLAEMLINTVDIRHSVNNLNQITLKGFPCLNDFFGVDPIP